MTSKDILEKRIEWLKGQRHKHPAAVFDLAKAQLELYEMEKAEHDRRVIREYLGLPVEPAEVEERCFPTPKAEESS